MSVKCKNVGELNIDYNFCLTKTNLYYSFLKDSSKLNYLLCSFGLGFSALY